MKIESLIIGVYNFSRLPLARLAEFNVQRRLSRRVNAKGSPRPQKIHSAAFFCGPEATKINSKSGEKKIFRCFCSQKFQEIHSKKFLTLIADRWRKASQHVAMLICLSFGYRCTSAPLAYSFAGRRRKHTKLQTLSGRSCGL